MTSSQKFTLGILSVIAGLMFVWVTISALHTYRTWAQKPLGPVLETETPHFVLTSLPYETPTLIPTGTLAPTLDFDLQNPNTPLCGGPARMNLLMIGADSRSGQFEYGLGDAIRLARIDFVTPRVTILEFPRDLWVEIPDINDNIGQDHEKLNQAYLYGNPGFHYVDNASRGPGLLARTLNLNFGVTVDHYIAVTMKTFIGVVDAIGGIDVNLPDGVDGRTSKDKSRRLIFPAGEQHLNGDQALTLARIRNVTVFVRAQHQDLVMCAVRKKLTSPEVVTQIPQIISAFQDNVLTDLTPEQISQFACLGAQMPLENILFASFPEKLFTPADKYDPVFKSYVFIWDVDFDILRDYVQKFQLGYWPTNPKFAPSPSTVEDTTGCS